MHTTILKIDIVHAVNKLSSLALNEVLLFMLGVVSFQLEPIEKARLDLTTSYTINSLFWGEYVSFIDSLIFSPTFIFYY